MSANEHSSRPVFFDPNGHRHYIVSAIHWAACSLAGILVTCLIVTSLAGPVMPSVQLSNQQRSLSASSELPVLSSDEPALDPAHARSPVAAAAQAATRYAHLVTWDDNSMSSLKRNAKSLDVLIVEWLHLDGPEGALKRETLEKELLVRKWVSTNAPALKLYPLVSNYDNKDKRWDSVGAAAMLVSDQARAKFVNELRRYAVAGGYPGLVLDLEQLPADAQPNLTLLVNELAAALRAESIRLLVQVPPSEPGYDYVKMAEASAGLILMTYDEHFEEGVPGPLAGQGWFEAQLDERFKEIDGSKLVIGIGSYGYNWGAAGDGKEISVQESWELLNESGAKLRFDGASLNPTFSYVDESEGRQHEVWFLDGVTAYNQVAAALAMRPAGLALWRLGTEDPGVWATFGRGRMSDKSALESIKELRSGYDLLYKGKGEVLDIAGAESRGARTVAFDAEHNLITNQEIVTFPSSTTVTRWGARDDKVVALTFDDGPDPIYTPQILDVLAAKGVKATFFVVGSSGVVNSHLLKRIYDEGHDLGNHTFTHLNSAEVSSEHLKFELNATQRLLEATVGARSRLFRPPYAADLEPTTIDGAEALRVSGSLGYLTIGMNIDPKDWMRPIARQIVANTVAGAKNGEGNVILLHDAGGIRTPTIAALPEIIDRLHAEGFRFVTIHELIGLKREEIMPRVKPDESLIATVNQAGFTLMSGINSLAGLLFQLGLALGTLRLIWVAAFALVHARRDRKRADQTWMPASLAVIIPAFNEEKVICNSVRALLASNIQDFEIIVVDDGSSDRTAEVARRTFAGVEQVRVLSKPNQGKWAALNYALARTDADIVVTLDADTIFEPDALQMLARHFADPKVAAVAGHTIVGNRINLMTRFQALEYVTNQNLDRRALEVVNGITVVPGAIGAWRRDALVAIGGFSPDTLAEDADATVRLELAGWEVRYEPGAIARTEAPETVRAFMKQRMRWMFGTLQVGFKHLSAMCRGRPIGVGWFGLPNIIVFQFLFTLMAPVIDLMLVWSLVSGINTLSMRADEGLPPALVGVIAYWAVFQILELATAALAISIDRRRNVWRLLPLLLVQRLFYRQLLYVTAIRVALAALKGRMQGWGKLRRTGRVVAEATAR
ncbi:MAG: glycosyltransferase [Bacteroidota bacterium]